MTLPVPTPRHWRVVSLGDLVSPTGQQIDPGRSPDRRFNYLSLENIEAGTGRLLAVEPTHGRDIGSTKITFSKGDLLYGRLRPYLQKVVIAPFDGIAATELWPIKVNSAVESQFLQQLLLGPAHKAEVVQLMSGARMPRVRSEQLLDMMIAVPPLEEQRLIVRALEVIRSQTASLRKRLTHGVELTETFEQALMTAAFSGRLSAEFRVAFPSSEDGEALLKRVLDAREAQWSEGVGELTSLRGTRARGRAQVRYPKPVALDRTASLPQLPAGWSWASVAQLTSALDPLCYGVVQPGDDVEKGVPLVRVQDLEDGGIKSDQLRRVTAAIDERHARSRLRADDVLVSLVGTIGRVAVVPNSLAEANIARALAKITPVQPALSQWIGLALQSKALQLWLTRSARGVARNTLNLAQLAQAPIPLPPPQEVQWLLRRLEFRKAAVSSMRRRLKDILVALDNLWATVQAQALNGAIVMKEPGDEAVAAAHRARLDNGSNPPSTAAGNRRTVISTKSRANTSAAPKRQMGEVLRDYPDGLEPMQLLSESGYDLQEVEEFFKVLAEAIARGELREERTDEDWPILVVA